ncbi:MAG: class I SAM-dependent methyltransferase [Pseudomonadota bacterium]
MDNRKEEERNFHDNLRDGAFGQRWSPELEKLIQENPLWDNMKYYSVERKSRKTVFDWFTNNCKGKKVLDYCCGNGDDSFIIAGDGASEIIGIDLSEVSIENCKKRTLQEGLEGKMSFQVMDAESLEFKEGTFDIVNEYGALHHLNLEKAYAEIARVLKKKGEFICTETLGHNPIINYYRKRTPNLRTPWEVEHILKKKDIYMAEKYFNKVEILGFFHLFALAAVPLRNSAGFNMILSALETIDSVLLKLPLLKWQAWQVVFVLSEPKKP